MNNTVLAIIELDIFPDVVAKRAAWIAGLYDCDLHLMLSDPTSSLLQEDLLVSNEAREIHTAVAAARQQFLNELCTPLKVTGGRQVTVSVRHERPAHEAIIAEALEREPRYVVKGTEYHSPAERARFTYTDWQLIQRLAVPLWLVKPHEWKQRPVLVAAVDPMHADDEQGALDQILVDTGKLLAEKCGGSLLLFHAYQRLVEIGQYAMFKVKPVRLPIDELDRHARDDHRKRLDALAGANKIAVEAVHQLPGRTSDVLPAFARSHGADAVIMGALDRSNRKQRALGSTAERVMDHLPCDILVVPG
ncbi:MAG: universal stress protein [Gammaproteobacteria bacterium]|nr:universal stress protein [Gammaproteobacteria bacterium]MDH5303109.1 universal stress protein [Gammaproteobacteria bacterium]MDH5323147.1 universal stress protein [Gammaproteobacteria bacterium]